MGEYCVSALLQDIYSLQSCTSVFSGALGFGIQVKPMNRMLVCACSFSAQDPTTSYARSFSVHYYYCVLKKQTETSPQPIQVTKIRTFHRAFHRIRSALASVIACAFPISCAWRVGALCNLHRHRLAQTSFIHPPTPRGGGGRLLYSSAYVERPSP